MIIMVTKRYTAPTFWPINVKENKYVVSAMPGPHKKDACMPLVIVLRNVLKHAETMKEAKSILNSGVVRVNGRVRKERGFPVGLMDVIEVDGEFHRIVPSKHGLNLYATNAEDGKVRLAKIVNKHDIGKNRVQISLHDGTNMLMEKNDYKTSDVLAIEAEKVKHHVKCDKGVNAVVTGGNNAGLAGKIHSIDRKLKTVVLAANDKEVIVPIKYVFVLGQDKHLVNIGE